MGNKKANQIWEFSIPSEYKKPKPSETKYIIKYLKYIFYSLLKYNKRKMDLFEI